MATDTDRPADVHVRPARPDEAAVIADLQVRTWQTAYAPILPAKALAGMAADDVAGRWTAALEQPPTPAHHVLVAVADGVVVGFAAVGPGTDEDLDASDGELYTLLVAVEAHREGHGSRLLAAAVDDLRASGFARAVSWLFETDVATVSFLESAGWALDGAHRDLDMGELAHQVRLHTDLG